MTIIPETVINQSVEDAAKRFAVEFVDTGELRSTQTGWLARTRHGWVDIPDDHPDLLAYAAAELFSTPAVQALARAVLARVAALETVAA